MKFAYSRHGLDPGTERWERLLEMIPASLSWGLLLFLFLLCIFAPVAGVVMVILFDLYWFFRLLYLTIFLVLSYGLLEVERTVNWDERLRDLFDLDSALERTRRRVKELRSNWKARFSEKKHLENLERLKREPIPLPSLGDLYHLVIIPFYKEGDSVLHPTLEALSRARYPLDRLVVVLGVEERAGEEAEEIARRLQHEYGEKFLHFEISIHPEGIPGEAAVKGANSTHAAKWARLFFESRGIPLDQVIVSCLDCDTVVGSDYFACVTYNYLLHPKRTRTSFQPIPVYHNNIWEAPPFARVLETGSSFLQLIEATNPEKLVTFSSHSMSFQALVEVGYWPVDLVSDDSAIFWKAYLIYEGDYRVHPLYVTVSMDVAVAENLWKTCQSIYRQKRRWAWGVENFPILVRGLLKNPKIPLFQKLRHVFRLLEMNVSWATWTPTMLLLSWTPALMATQEFASSVVHFNAPRITGVICNLMGASLLISIILSLLLLPRSKKRISFQKKLIFALQWLSVPVIATVFGAIPALDAQTRLALGRYLEFFVTPKGLTPKGRFLPSHSDKRGSGKSVPLP